MKRFPPMGFDVAKREAIIYDEGEEQFSGTTLEGIGQAVVGILRKPEETKNRFVKVWSVKTCQNELLEAFEAATGTKWEVKRDTTKALVERGRELHRQGNGGWRLYMAIAVLFNKGEGMGLVARTREETDCEVLGLREESVRDIVAKVLGP